MIEWFKKFFRLVTTFDSTVAALHRRVHLLENIIAERTTVNVDVSMRGLNHVIVVGRYRNLDYIQTYSVKETDFCSLVETLKNMQKYGTVNRLDAPPQIQAVMKREFE